MNFVSSAPLIEALTMPEIHGCEQWDDFLKNSWVDFEVADRLKLRQKLGWATKLDTIEERFDLYNSLNKLLATGTNDRFVLYCPLYLIPNGYWYRRQYGGPVDSFIELFVSSWFRMLQVHDIRANFINGDVPDIEFEYDEQPLDMVVQAAYLAPILIERGLIQRRQIPEDDPVLVSSLKDAFQPLQIESEYVFNRTRSFCESVADGLIFQVPAGISEKRAKWLQMENRRQCMSYMAKTVGRWITEEHNFPLTRINTDTDDSKEVVAMGIGSAIESLWSTGFDFCNRAAADYYQQYGPYLEELYQIEAIRDTITSVFCRLYSIGFTTRGELDRLGIFYPCLEGPLSRNLSPIQAELTIIGQKLSDPELSKIIYPAVVVFGSRLKGYGGADSDIDLAVFVRPESNCACLGKLLKDKLGHNTVEFWLEEDGPDLRVIDFPELAANIGHSTNTNVLLGGAWLGDSPTISMLGQRLLRPYFREKNQAVRDVWLGEMEKDFLQYRLLHRGYERFNVPRNSNIFLDDGYRTVASQLYVSHVFIPDER
jgi:hypothetical protein